MDLRANIIMETNFKRFKTKNSEIYLDDEGILWLKPINGADLDLEEVTACFDIYKKMGINKDNKVLQIIDAQVMVTMNKDGRDYAALHGIDFFIASAVISNNLSVRLIVNFFNIFYKSPLVPLKMFESEESAKKWLFKFKH